MKKKLLFIPLIAVMLAINVVSCSKDQNKELTEISEDLADYDEVTKFLSDVSSIPVDQLKFNLETKEYYLPNSNFKEDYNRVRGEYLKSKN